MATPFPRGMPIRQAPGMSQMPQMPIQQGMAGDVGQALGAVGGEIDQYTKQKQMMEEMVSKRQLAADIQRTREEWKQAENSLQQAKAEEAQRHHETQETERGRQHDEKLSQQKVRDENLRKFQEGKLEKKGAGGAKRNMQGFGNIAKRALSDIDDGFQDPQSAMEENQKAIQEVQSSLSNYENYMENFGPGTKGPSETTPGRFWGENTTYQSDTPEGQAGMKRNETSMKRQMLKDEKELKDRMMLQSQLEAEGGQDMGQDITSEYSTPESKGINDSDIQQAISWMEANPGPQAEEMRAAMESAGYL